MKCNSCKSEIDTKWKFAIDRNSCPFCGEEILPVELKEKIDAINTLFNSFPQIYLSDIEDWLFSNFNLVKINSEKFFNLMPPKIDVEKLKLEWEESFNKKEKILEKNFENFSVKNNDEDEDEKDPSLLKKHDQNITDQFFKRTGVNNPAERTEKLKSLVKQIKKGTNTNSLQEEEFEDDEFDEDSNFSDQELNKLQLTTAVESFDSKNLINSSLQTSDDEDEDEVPMALVSAMKNMKNGNGNNKDLIALQQMQSKNKSSKNRMLSGRGAFSRSS